MIVNNEFERMRKETTVTQFQATFRHASEGTEENHKNTSIKIFSVADIRTANLQDVSQKRHRLNKLIC
jgi:hypothetical protein